MDDEILAADAATLQAETFTIGAWVFPTRVNPTAPQEIIVRSDSEVGGEIGPQPTYARELPALPEAEHPQSPSSNSTRAAPTPCAG